MDSISDLFINWHLLDGLNHDTEYSSAPSRSFHERYPREELLKTAYSLLSVNRQQYIFHFYGGEPTIHPHFKELLAYISTSGRNTRVILDTNGIRSKRYYLALLKTQSPGRFYVRLSVHCKYTEIQPLSYLIAHIVECGFFCQVTVNHVPAYASKATVLFQKLIELRKHLSFSLRLAFPMGGESAWPGDREFLYESLPEWTSYAEESGTASMVHVIDEPYACVGVNCVQVSADGVCTLGLRTRDKEFAPTVMEEPILCDGLPRPPTFLEYSEAKEWLESFKRNQIVREIEGGAIRHPLHSEFDAEQIFRMRLKRLPRGAATTSVQYPELWTDHKNDLLKAQDFFADEESRQVFFALVRAHCTGDGSCLLDSSYKAFEHPAIDDSLYPFSETATKFCRRIRCSSFTPEVLEDILPRIAWYRPAAEIALPDDSSWICALLCLRKAFAGYDLYLGCHNGQHILYAAPNPPRKRIPLPVPRAADGIPLLSFIVPVGDDDRLLHETVESILAERLVRYEIVLVLNSDALLMTVRDYVRREPWCIREYRVDDALSYWECCDAGIEMAQGEYAVFLRPGCVLEQGVAGKVLRTLKNEECGAVLCGAGKNAIFPRKSAVMAFLSGSLGEIGLENTVCRTSLLRSYGIRIAQCRSFDASFLLLQLLHPSKKAAVIAFTLVRDRDDDALPPTDRGADFARLLSILVSFYRAHSLSLASKDLVDYVWDKFRSVSSDFMRFLRKKNAEGSLDELLTSDFLSGLAAFPFIARDIAHMGLRKRRVQNFSDISGGQEREYRGLDSGENTPILSLCLSFGCFSSDDENDRNFSVARVRTLADAFLFDVDFLLIDSSGNEQFAAELDDLADIYPSVRVFHTAPRCSEARVRGIGLTQARARYVTFITRPESATEDFLSDAQTAARTADNTEIILPRYPGLLGNTAQGEEILSCLFDKGLPLSLDAMLINREWLEGFDTSSTDSNTETLQLEDDEDSDTVQSDDSDLTDMVSDPVFVLSLLDRVRSVSFFPRWTPQYGVRGPVTSPRRRIIFDADEEISVLDASLAIIAEVIEKRELSDTVVQGIRGLVTDLLSQHADLLRIHALESGEAFNSLSMARTLLAL